MEAKSGIEVSQCGSAFFFGRYKVPIYYRNLVIKRATLACTYGAILPASAEMALFLMKWSGSPGIYCLCSYLFDSD